MRLRSVVPVVSGQWLFLIAAASSSPCLAQGRTIDEGAFIVTAKGRPAQTESFKIARIDNGLIQATAQLIAGDDRISSALVADSLGTPVSYLYLDKTHGATTLTVRALAGGHRISLTSSDNKSTESMKDFPLLPGGTLILDDGLLHQLYFVTVTKRAGAIHLIHPRTGRHEEGTLTGKGMEPVEIAGRSVTATHYSLVIGSRTQEFWVDSEGRVLRVEVPAEGLTAVREELPR
ncbi:MAG TPA: DUF6134 family protein [Gemmatimonadaceae bacterium]|jgi:hypothetical protein